MRTLTLVAMFSLCSLSLIAQPSPRVRGVGSVQRSIYAANAESAIKLAMNQLADDKKAYDRDLGVLRRLQAAARALTDPSQPNNAVQRAYEEVAAAKALGSSEMAVKEGLIKADRELEAARRSPGTTDFGRLRSILQTDAIGPASRVVARNGAALQEETLSWLRVQELISVYLRGVAEISAESLRASQQ